MKLNFMGQSYSLSQPQLTTIASENTACYRGQLYNLRVPVTISKGRSPESELIAVVQKYRGVSYVVERYQFVEKTNKHEHCY